MLYNTVKNEQNRFRVQNHVLIKKMRETRRLFLLDKAGIL